MVALLPLQIHQNSYSPFPDNTPYTKLPSKTCRRRRELLRIVIVLFRNPQSAIATWYEVLHATLHATDATLQHVL
jgi:hypothetical protein